LIGVFKDVRLMCYPSGYKLLQTQIFIEIYQS